jgi:hypothetical protein
MAGSQLDLFGLQPVMPDVNPGDYKPSPEFMGQIRRELEGDAGQCAGGPALSVVGADSDHAGRDAVPLDCALVAEGGGGVLVRCLRDRGGTALRA